jgi:hypothetical protein
MSEIPSQFSCSVPFCPQKKVPGPKVQIKFSDTILAWRDDPNHPNQGAMKPVPIKIMAYGILMDVNFQPPPDLSDEAKEFLASLELR